MPIYFRNTPVSAPFMFDSIGNHWIEEETCRPEGYPHYHYLQTESGCGQIEIQGNIYELRENEGFLIAPSIPHSYKKKSDLWIQRFCYLYRNTRIKYLCNGTKQKCHLD